MHGYYCSLCRKNHQMKSVVGKEHYPYYVSEQRRLDRLADEKRARKKPVSKSEQTKRLQKAIFGRSKRAIKGG